MHSLNSKNTTNSQKFYIFLKKYAFLFGAMLGLNSVKDFIALFNNPNDLIYILKATKLTESFYRKLLLHVKNNPLFHERLVRYYALLRANKEKAKNLFLTLIENEWVRNNVIFIKGPVLSHQLYGNIDEKLYSDVDIVIDKKCIKNLMTIIKRYGHYYNIRFGKFTQEVILPHIGLLDVVFKDYIPFDVSSEHICINGRKLMTLSITDTFKISVFFSFFEIRYFDTCIIRNTLLVNNDIVNANFLEHNYLSIAQHIYVAMINKNYNDKVLRDFYLITFHSKNILKKIFYLLKFMNKYNIKFPLSYFYTGKQYLFRRILNMAVNF